MRSRLAGVAREAWWRVDQEATTTTKDNRKCTKLNSNLLLGAGKNNRNCEPMSDETRAKEGFREGGGGKVRCRKRKKKSAVEAGTQWQASFSSPPLHEASRAGQSCVDYCTVLGAGGRCAPP